MKAIKIFQRYLSGELTLREAAALLDKDPVATPLREKLDTAETELKLTLGALDERTHELDFARGECEKLAIRAGELHRDYMVASEQLERAKARVVELESKLKGQGK